MHVRKSILIACAATILILTAALAYMVGESSHDVPVQPVQPPAPAKIVEPREVLMASTPDPHEVKALPITPSAATVAHSANHTKTFTSSEQRKIDIWSKAMEMCRGSSVEQTIETWCPRYAAAQKELNQIGICYGHDDDQSAAEYEIHRCRQGSYRD